MEKKAWKIIAIIFMVLFLLETMTVITLYNIGMNVIEHETECALNVCDNAESYYFDEYTNICECYVDNQITKTRLID